MKTQRMLAWGALWALAGILVSCLPSAVQAHCDTMNGPVVVAAREALATGNVSLVLIWVQKEDESVIREAFRKTLDVRKLSADARNLADMYFFETLVRIHRAGEGVAYTGLKPAETEVDPGIAAADQALAKGSSDRLLKHLDEEVRHSIQKRFTAVMGARQFDANNVEAGRQYVKSYVEFIHAVERLFGAIRQPVHGHSGESERVEAPHDHH